MEHKIVMEKAFTVVGLKYTGKPGSREIPQLWQQFVPRMAEVPNRADPIKSYGVMGQYDHQTGAFSYMAGLPVTDTMDIPADMESWSVPAGRYAVFTTCLEALRQDYDTIYNKVMPQQGFAHADAPDFELYDSRFKGGPTDPIDIYVAIQ